MSKASEWGVKQNEADCVRCRKTICDDPACRVVVRLEEIDLGTDNEVGMEICQIEDGGKITSVTLCKNEAEALARWITDVFGDNP